MCAAQANLVIHFLWSTTTCVIEEWVLPSSEGLENPLNSRVSASPKEVCVYLSWQVCFALDKLPCHLSLTMKLFSAILKFSTIFSTHEISDLHAKCGQMSPSQVQTYITQQRWKMLFNWDSWDDAWVARDVIIMCSGLEDWQTQEAETPQCALVCPLSLSGLRKRNKYV